MIEKKVGDKVHLTDSRSETVSFSRKWITNIYGKIIQINPRIDCVVVRFTNNDETSNNPFNESEWLASSFGLKFVGECLVQE